MLKDQPLHTYLNDHLAGAVGAIKLVESMVEKNPEGALHEDLKQLLVEIQEDKHVLQEITDQVEGSESTVKKAGAFVFEKIGRLKRGQSLTGYSDLRRLEELEALSLGIYGKLSLWRSLRAVSKSAERFHDFDFAELEQRAHRQYKVAEKHRLDAAESAFTHVTS